MRTIIGKLSDRVLRVRYKDTLGIRSKLVIGTEPKKVKKMGDRIIRVGKISYEELYHVGSYNRMPQLLMREFRTGKPQEENSLKDKIDSISKDLALNTQSQKI
jgi:polyhydroxyalkanoate synthesis regulator phasin